MCGNINARPRSSRIIWRALGPASLHADYPMNYDHSEISDKHYFIVTATCQKEQWREIIYKNYFYVHAKNVRQVEGNIAVKIAPICIQISPSAVENHARQ